MSRLTCRKIKQMDALLAGCACCSSFMPRPKRNIGAIAQHNERLRAERLIAKQRARAVQAVQRLRECASTRDATEKLCAMFTDRRGPASFDCAYAREFKHLFNALHAGLRDGIV